MGNRAVITTRERNVGIYLHWNGGLDSVAAFLRYCELQGYPAPGKDSDYGMARLAQVIANFFSPGGSSIGIFRYTDDEAEDPGDNGVYILDGWRIARHIEHGRETRCDIDVPDGDLLDIDACQPECMRLGGFITAREVPASEVEIGQKVYVRAYDGSLKELEVLGFTERHGKALPYVDRWGSPTPEDNPNNILTDRFLRVAD